MWSIKNMKKLTTEQRQVVKDSLTKKFNLPEGLIDTLFKRGLGKKLKGDKEFAKLGKDLDTETGYEAAKRCGLSIVAQAKKACDEDLSKIKSCIKLTGFVNSTEDFTEQPKVINGASDLIALIFGEAGMHTRAAVSVNSLPLGVSVEVDAIFELN